MNFLCHPISLFTSEESRNRRLFHSRLVQLIDNQQRARTLIGELIGYQAAAPAPHDHYPVEEILDQLLIQQNQWLGQLARLHEAYDAADPWLEVS